jgi:NADH-quinone oxidoreductase subunit N
VLDLARSLPAGGGVYYVLAIAAIANTAVSAYYYLKVVKAMYFEGMDEGADGALRSPALGRLVVLAMVLLTFYLFLRADALLSTTLNLEMHV